MDANAMIDAAALLLGIGALGGLVMLVPLFGQKRNPPVWLAMVHGFAGAAGLTLLGYAWWAAGIPTLAQAATALLVVAAVGGIVINLRDHWNRAPLSRTWVIGHLVLAVTGYALLLRVTLT